MAFDQQSLIITLAKNLIRVWHVVSLTIVLGLDV